MTEKYEMYFREYKEFIESNSKYGTRVVKYNTHTSSYFPIASFALSNWTDSNNCTIDKIEKYDNVYFTIDIYTKDKIINGKTIASQIINNELIELTIQFFDKKNMYRTGCRPTPNIDTEILRTTIQYQCMIGNIRGNIIRR